MCSPYAFAPQIVAGSGGYPGEKGIYLAGALLLFYLCGTKAWKMSNLDVI